MAKSNNLDNQYKIFKAQLKKSIDVIGDGYEQSLEQFSPQIFSKVQHYIPIDTGALSNSISTRVQGKKFNAKLRVSAGNSKAPYALRVHEDLEMRHGTIFNIYYANLIAKKQTHSRRPQESAKYVSKAVEETKNKLINLIKSISKRKMKYVKKGVK